VTERTAVVVLAGGRGARMRSALPKVLHEAAGRPVLDRVLATARAAAAEAGGARLVVVTNAGVEDPVAAHVKSAAPEATLALQRAPLGTGDAMRSALPAIGAASRVVVLPGDAPLVTAASVRRLLEALDGRPETPAVFLSAVLPDPTGYGRVLRDPGNTVVAVVEEAQASERELALDEVNGGVYAFDRPFLEAALARLEPGAGSSELYLTDLLAMAVESGRPVRSVPAAPPEEILGVNSQADLARVEGVLRARAAAAAMAGGAALLRPETVTLDETVALAPDTVVEPFVTLLGATRVGGGTRIGQGCVIRDTVIGSNVTVRPYCVMEGARVGDGAVVGPFARLREGTDLGPAAHVGNFVETKKAVLGAGAKANHLTYLGDATVGEGTNVGAGVITCNYDGVAKHPTTIGKGVFVGSDVQLVAPVTVGDGAVIGAGTTVTSDVPPDALVTSRAPLKTVEGGGAAYRERKSGKKRK
jgi:bifunctional UDP-N-acetylglucosamine pyrophosphorylase / glucosamine-1-phosphate N-acetyltransferase